MGQGRPSYINVICCVGRAEWHELYIIYNLRVTSMEQCTQSERIEGAD